MNESKGKKSPGLARVILAFTIFAVEFYLYVFVRNDNILDLIVTILTGILFIVLLTVYIVHSVEGDPNK